MVVVDSGEIITVDGKFIEVGAAVIAIGGKVFVVCIKYSVNDAKVVLVRAVDVSSDVDVAEFSLNAVGDKVFIVDIVAISVDIKGDIG